MQGSDTLVSSTSRKHSSDNDHRDRDIEKNPAKAPHEIVDPFMFRAGVKTEDELNELRQRKHVGKKLESYQRKQNIVCINHLLRLDACNSRS